MGFYPISVQMKGRRCLVIGGGSVAGRKVQGLVAVDASVTVISPTLTRPLEELVNENRCGYHRRSYKDGDLAGYQLVFVATDDPTVHAAVYEEGTKRGVWVNAADDPAHCDFILPSVLRRGDLAVAVSTGGKSPALARSIREELEDYFTADDAAVIEVVAEVREELRSLALSPAYETWRRALKGAFRQYIRRGEATQARKLLLKKLGATPCE